MHDVKTNAKMINSVRQKLQLQNIDTWLPASYIYENLIDKASLFIKREADDRRMSRYTDIWTPIPGFALERKELVEAAGFAIPNCKYVMQSKEKLPKVFSARFGYLLNILSPDYSIDYRMTTPIDFPNTQGKEFSNPRVRYWWLNNDNIVIADSEVQSVFVTGVFKNKAEALRLNYQNKGKCIMFLDSEFSAPSHLLSDIEDAAALSIANIFLKTQADEYPNMNKNEKENPQP